jgi:hypothetical protein
MRCRRDEIRTARKPQRHRRCKYFSAAIGDDANIVDPGKQS